VFVRGFVLQYARALGLSDAEKLANAFLERMDG
jgi:cytoskeletal protein RodZ